MAEYQLTRKEHDDLLGSVRPPRPWIVRILLRVLLLLTVASVFGLLFYFRQWLFAAGLLSFIAFYIYMQRRRDPATFQCDSFKSGLVRVDVLSDRIRFTAGPNNAGFAYADLRHVLEYQRCFVVSHPSGFWVRIPRDRLSQDEVSTLIGLQLTFPHLARKMYK
jgi:hypothetical protein